MSELATPVAKRNGAALAVAGIAAAGLLAARSAQAQTATPTHVTLYFSAAPAANGTTLVQIPKSSTAKGTSSDIQVVNFALAAETLEAELYRQVIARLTTGGTTDGLGQAIDGLGLTTSDQSVSFTTEFIQVESAQRDFLAMTLYGSAAANPFLPGTASTSMKYAYSTPSGVQGVGNFSHLDCIEALYLSELRGIAGYLAGSAALSIVSGGNPYLKIAAAALGVEARHAACHALSLTTLGTTVSSAPLPSQNSGKDVSASPDAILNGGITGIPNSIVGTIPAVSGPAGYVYM